MRSRCGTTASCAPEFVALARKYGVAIVYADHANYPAIADVTGDFVYARLQTGSRRHPDRLHAEALDDWAARAKDLGAGGGPADLPAPIPPPTRRSSRATCSSSSSTRARCARPFGAMALMKRVAG